MYYIEHSNLKDFSSQFPHTYVCCIINNRQCPSLSQITTVYVNNQLLNKNTCALATRVTSFWLLGSIFGANVIMCSHRSLYLGLL
jgi:hypothetical protein